MAPIKALEEAGARITRATDTKSHDLFETMRAALAINRVQGGGRTIYARAALRWATAGPLGAPEPSAEELVTRLAAEAAAGAELVILGGSRLSPHAAALRARTAMTVVEPVACAVTMAESLVRIGLSQSKAGKYARPPRPLADYR